MKAIRLFKLLNRDQRNTFIACFLGWALDAFDFFLLTFVIVPMARDFSTSVADLSYAITITLAMRPVGAFIFGLLGDRFGRRIPLMTDIIFYSLMELLTAFSPNYTWLLIFRALYGIGMGGEWGLGASLAMETLPTAARGLFSGILQQGYAFGYLLAAFIGSCFRSSAGAVSSSQARFRRYLCFTFVRVSLNRLSGCASSTRWAIFGSKSFLCSNATGRFFFT